MMLGVETKLEGTTLIVRIPMRFQRRGGRKRIVASDCSELTPATKPQPDGTLVQALARAWRWQRLLDGGRYATVAEIAQTEQISPSYVSRVLRLTLLAPEIVEHILNGRDMPSLLRLMRPFPVEWEKQHADLDSGRHI
jgi:hypothetical protein